MSATITTTLTADKTVLDAKIADLGAAKSQLDTLLLKFMSGEDVPELELNTAQQSWSSLSTEVETLKGAYRQRAEESLKTSKAAYDTAVTNLNNGVALFKAKGEGLANLRGLKSAADSAKSEYESARTALGLGSLSAPSGTPRTGQGGWRGIKVDGDRGIANGSVAHPSASGTSGRNAYVLRLDRSGRLLRHFPSEHVYDAVIAALQGSEDQGRAFVAVNALQSTRSTASKGRIAVYVDRTVARILRPTLVALGSSTDRAVANNVKRHVKRLDEYLALSTDEMIAQSGSANKPGADEDPDDLTEGEDA